MVCLLTVLHRSTSLFLGIRANIYPFSPEIDPEEFILLAVQHYFIINGKDVESDQMKKIVQDLLPAPYYMTQSPDAGTKGSKAIKPILSEKEIDGLVQAAVQKDADVSSGERESASSHHSINLLSYSKFKRVIKRLKQKFKTREQIKREIKKDVLLYAQGKWALAFSRIFEINSLSGPLIDEVPFAFIAVGKDKIRLGAEGMSVVLNEINYSEVTDIVSDQ